MPGPYAFKQIFAADPSNTSNVAKGGSVLLFAPGDASRKPLVVTDLANGMVLPNPVPVNSNGFGPAFLHETLPQVAWEGGGFSGTYESFEGLRADAVAAVAASQASAQAAGDARVAAEAAAGNAAAGAAGALAGAVAEATAAKTAAQAAAGLVGAPAGAAVLAAIQPGGAAHGALSGTYAPVSAGAAGVKALASRPSNTIVHIGDSLTVYSGGQSTSTPTQALEATLLDGKGIHNWANFFLGKDLAVLGNSGIGGQTSEQILARFTTDALNLNPAMVGILAGTNDPVDMDTIGNLTAMYTAALNAGMRVIAQTVPPSTVSAAGIEARRLKVNDWIRSYARNTPGVILSDMAAAWQDPTLAGYKPIPAYVHDGTHPNVAGAMAAGRVFADALRPFVPRNRTRAAAAVAPFNLLGNPHFNGTVDLVNATTYTMGAWNISGAGLTVTALDRTDGYSGRMLQIVVPAGGAVNLTTNADVNGTTLKLGDVIDFGIELEIAGVETDPSAAKTVTAFIQQYDGGGFSNRSYELYADAGASYGNGLAIPDGSYRLSTPPVAVAPGRVLIQNVMSLNGGGTYRLKGGYMRNITRIAAV